MTLFSKKPEETPEVQTLGMRISEERKKHGYTQEEFSQKLNVTAQAVSKWENDLSCPDIQLLPQISKLLDISIDELLTGKDKKTEEHDSSEKPQKTDNLRLQIHVISPNKRPTDVTLPMSMVKRLSKIGNGISGVIGGTSLGQEQLEQILELIEDGAVGELLNVTAEDGTEVVIEIK